MIATYAVGLDDVSLAEIDRSLKVLDDLEVKVVRLKKTKNKQHEYYAS